MLVVVVGCIGAGKTTLARHLEQRLSFVRLSADEIRLRTAGTPTSWSPVVWDELQRLAADALADGRDVVVDATGSASRFPSLVASLGDSFVVRLECDWRSWQQREGRRDRTGVRYPDWRYSLVGSRRVVADLVIDTSHRSPLAVCDLVVSSLERYPRGVSR